MPADKLDQAVTNLEKRVVNLERLLKDKLAVQKAEDHGEEIKQMRAEFAKEVKATNDHMLVMLKVSNTAGEESRARTMTAIRQNEDMVKKFDAQLKSNEAIIADLKAQTVKAKAAEAKQVALQQQQQAEMIKHQAQLAEQHNKDTALELRLKQLEAMVQAALGRR